MSSLASIDPDSFRRESSESARKREKICSSRSNSRAHAGQRRASTAAEGGGFHAAPPRSVPIALKAEALHHELPVAVTGGAALTATGGGALGAAAAAEAAGAPAGAAGAAARAAAISRSRRASRRR